jgi:hypothetical protein
MKWHWSLLSAALFGSFALAQGTPEKINNPKDSNPIALGAPDAATTTAKSAPVPP